MHIIELPPRRGSMYTHIRHAQDYKCSIFKKKKSEAEDTPPNCNVQSVNRTCEN